MEFHQTYHWPGTDWTPRPPWRYTSDRQAVVRDMPEDAAELTTDSRWPAFFPVSLSIATTAYAGRTAMERISGASIVNRFPYLLAISVCRKTLSRRHHARLTFMEMLERSGRCAVQFPTPGRALDAALRVSSHIPEEQSGKRVIATELPSRHGIHSASPIFDASYLVYEGRLVEPSRDFEGADIFPAPWIDVGSHRLYFLEVTAIQLRAEIAAGEEHIRWRSLPMWNAEGTNGSRGWTTTSRPTTEASDTHTGEGPAHVGCSAPYVKGYSPNYIFPSSGTVRFEPTGFANGMAIRELSRDAADQIETDNDRARWPCFFPSAVGMITTWADSHTPNLMPCGSTTVVSRSPFMIAPCVSYARINQRYAPRATLDIVRRTGRFGCGVPFLRDDVVNAIRYAGSRSMAEDPGKVASCGLEVQSGGPSPVLPELPIHYDCEVTGEVRMGTHVMFLGEVRRIRVRSDVHAANPMEWRPWAHRGEHHISDRTNMENELVSA